MSILDTERELYDTMWSSVDLYAKRSPAEDWFSIFLSIVGTERGTVLDAGCGSGKGAVALKDAGFTVLMCDVTNAGLVPEAREIPFKPACLWHDLQSLAKGFGGFYFNGFNRTKFDYVFCTDVLEHVPPQFTMLAVEQMLRVAKRGVFLSVSTREDEMGVWVGESLHKTVRPYLWWKEALEELGTVTDARDLFGPATFYVVPRGGIVTYRGGTDRKYE